jgi:hypothetical protein
LPAIPLPLQAGLWGLVAGGALVVGAAVAWFARVPQRLIAATMAFGAGVLISALAFELVEEALHRGGFSATAMGFVGGAAAYTFANWLLARYGARHRKRSGRQPSEKDDEGSGVAIAIGALLDGVPESIVIGLSMLEGGAVSMVGPLRCLRLRRVERDRTGVRGIGLAWRGRVRRPLRSHRRRDHGHCGRRGAGDDRRHHDSRGLRADPYSDRPDHRIGLPDRLRADRAGVTMACVRASPSCRGVLR